MAKYKKEVYTMIEIAERVMEKWPGRYKSIASANAAVRGAARELGIGDINGKGKYKNIAAKGAERILEHLGKNYRKTHTAREDREERRGYGVLQGTRGAPGSSPGYTLRA